QGAPEIFRCPADRGDIFREANIGDYKTTNCYAQYGNSYLMEWAVDFVRVRRVTGDIQAAKGSDVGKSIKTPEIAAAAAKKIVQGDWVWHVNRGYDNPKSIWHNFRGRSLSIMAFGDGHATAFKFPLKPISDSFWAATPSPANDWW